MVDATRNVTNTHTLTRSYKQTMDSRLGLNQTAQKPDGPVRVRTAPKGIPKRDGPIWKTVTVVKEHPTTPSVQCINLINFLVTAM